MPNRLPEFFEGDNKRLSMARLLAFLSFWPASSVLGVIHNETALGIYIGAYVLQYGSSKYFDMKSNPKQRSSK